MSSVAISFASLVKSNNGMFKSAKQAEFLLSQCDNGEFVACDSMYGNSYNNTYVCDAQGVLKVVHYTVNTGDKVVWERVEAGKVSVQESKEFKRIMRAIKGLEKQIADRAAAIHKYDDMDLYNNSMQRDMDQLADYQAKL